MYLVHTNVTYAINAFCFSCIHAHTYLYERDNIMMKIFFLSLSLKITMFRMCGVLLCYFFGKDFLLAWVVKNNMYMYADRHYSKNFCIAYHKT